MKSWRNDFSIHSNFLITRKENLFYCCVKVFTLKDDWERFYETILPEKEDFYSHLSMDDINDADYAHSKMVWKILK